MSSIILLFLCLFLGIFFRVTKIFPKETPVVLNQFVLYISLPAMALFYLPKIELSTKLLFPVGVAWIGFFLAVGLCLLLRKIYGWSDSLTRCLILTAGLGNTSFVGIPVVETLYGREGLKTLVMVDLPGTFMILSTFGIFVASSFSRKKTDLKSILFKILKFPAFIAFIIGFSAVIVHLQFPPVLDNVFEKLSMTVSPIALISVGYQLKIQKESKHWGFLAMGLIYQLVLLPLVIFILYKFVFDQSGLEFNVSVIEAAMAPMITASIIASSYGLKPKLSSMMVGVGIPVSFITIAIWYWILTYF